MEIAEHLTERLEPQGVGVVIEAEHTCMSLRGARAEGARTVTAALRGRLRDDPKTRAEFLSLTRDRAVRPMSAPIVLVGGGLATGTAVRELRAQGYDGDAGRHRRRARTRRTSVRRCPRATCSATTPPRRRWSTTRRGTPSTTSTCAPA